MGAFAQEAGENRSGKTEAPQVAAAEAKSRRAAETWHCEAETPSRRRKIKERGSSEENEMWSHHGWNPWTSCWPHRRRKKMYGWFTLCRPVLLLHGVQYLSLSFGAGKNAMAWSGQTTQRNLEVKTIFKDMQFRSLHAPWDISFFNIFQASYQYCGW